MKKAFISILGVLIIIGLILIYRPISFYDSFDEISIGYMEPRFNANGEPKVYTAEFCYLPQDNEFQQLKEIFSNYSYHRTFTSFLRKSINWEGPGGSMTVGLISNHTGQSFTLSPSSLIMVDSNVYRVGYWGKAKMTALLNDIKAVLELEPD